MDETTLVGGVESGSDLRDDIGDAPRIKRPLFTDEGAEVRTIHDPHREVQPAGLLTSVVNRDHVRVLDRCGEPRLPRKTGTKALIRG